MNANVMGTGYLGCPPNYLGLPPQVAFKATGKVLSRLMDLLIEPINEQQR